MSRIVFMLAACLCLSLPVYDGHFTPPEVPGVGLDIDESKIESERSLSWA